MMKFNLINDEPVTEDSLGREKLIDGLVAGVKDCNTPFVMAINGGWGTGKTSILKCMEHKINPDKEKKGKRKYPTIWFSPWKFQFEEKYFEAKQITTRMQGLITVLLVKSS